MDWYLLVKFLHVAAAIVWIGSGVGLVILGIAADSRKDEAEYGRIIKQVVFMAPRVFIPSSVAVLVLGIIAAWMSWGFNVLWIDIGLLGFAATFITGNFLLKPRADKVDAILKSGPINQEGMGIGRELLAIAKFDYVMLFVVVADMVFKPTGGDWLVLLLMVVALLLAGFFFLAPLFRPRMA